MLQYNKMPMEAFAFLGAVAFFLLLLIVFFLYLNKMLCFRECGGFPCIERIPVKDKSKLGSAFNYDDGETSSDSDDEVLQRYQRSMRVSQSNASLRQSGRAPPKQTARARLSSDKGATQDARLVSLAEKGGHPGYSSEEEVEKLTTPTPLLPGVSPGPNPTQLSPSNYHSDEERSLRGVPVTVTYHGEERVSETVYENSAFEGGAALEEEDHHQDRSQLVPTASAQSVSQSGTSTQISSTLQGDNESLTVTGVDKDPHTQARVELIRKSSMVPTPEASAESDVESSGFDPLSDKPGPPKREHMFDVSDLQDREPALISKCGNLEVTFNFDRRAGRMKVTIHAAKDIPTKDRGGSNHNQIRMLLLPNKKVRYKTKIKSGDDPAYEENFTFKVPEEDVDQMGVRFRLYGCERMRRERMIGESVVGFASLNLDTSTTHLLNLEPRSNLSHGDSRMDVSSLSRSDSASSTQSMQYGGMPELLIGLSYNGTTGRLSTEVIKGSNFRNMAMNRAPDTYVKLTLISPNGQEIARSKTSVRRGQPNPLFKETFMFQVALFQLPDVTLMVSVYNKRSMKRKDMIGWFSLGYNNSGEEEASHWTDMRECKGEQVCRWHVLLEA